MARRVLALALAGVLAALLAGCSGRDAVRAQQVLAESNTALHGLRSASFSLNVTASQNGSQLATLTFGGAGYLKGPRRGDFRLKMDGGGALGAAGAFQLVERNHRLYLDTGSGWRQAPVPARSTSPSQLNVGALDLTRYVKDVRVEEDAVANGEPSVKVEGTLDTAGLLTELVQAVPTGLSNGAAVDGVAQMASQVGDTHVLLYLSKATHLPVRAFVALQVKDAGQALDLSLDFSLGNVDKPVVVTAPS